MAYQESACAQLARIDESGGQTGAVGACVIDLLIPGDLSLQAFILILRNCKGTVCPGGQDPRLCVNLFPAQSQKP